MSFLLFCHRVSGLHVSRAHGHHANMVLLQELVLGCWIIWWGRQGKSSYEFHSFLTTLKTKKTRFVSYEDDVFGVIPPTQRS